MSSCYKHIVSAYGYRHSGRLQNPAHMSLMPSMKRRGSNSAALGYLETLLGNLATETIIDLSGNNNLCLVAERLSVEQMSVDEVACVYQVDIGG